GDDWGWVNPNILGHRVLEGPIPLPEHHADVAVVEVGDGQVGLTVTAEVSHCDRTWTRTYGVGVRRKKTAASIVQRHGNDIRPVVCDCEIQCAVAVEISGNHELRKASRRDVPRQRKGAIA